MKLLKLDRNQLKYIAAFFMVLDSLYLRGFLPSVFHLLTRFVAPLFAWMMVEGFFHTSSRSAYCRRLWTAAALMQIGDAVSALLFGSRHLGIGDNIFLTLALGFSAIWLIEQGRTEQDRGKAMRCRAEAIAVVMISLVLSVIPIPLFADAYIGVEGGIMLVPLILIAYFCHGRLKEQAVLYTAYCLVIGILSGALMLPQNAADWDMLFVNSDWATFLVFPVLMLYSGKGGRRTSFDKYFFYVLYPLHLWIIAAAAFWLR